MPQQTVTIIKRLPPVLQGRVFERLHHFAALPVVDLQEDTKQFQAYVEQHKHTLFENHYHALITSVYSVRGEALVNAIIRWLQTRTTEFAHEAHTTTAADAAGEAPEAKASAQTASVSINAGESAPASSELLGRAKKIAEALVLSGFLTPCSDNADTDAAAANHFCLSENELLVPVGKNVTKLKTNSVWSVVDGAIYAQFLKRKAGMSTNSKDVYVVLNENTKTAYLFESDVAREPIAEVHGESATVQSDTNLFEFGVRVTTHSLDAKDKPELIDAGTKQAQEEFVNAWLAIGAQHYENNLDKMAEANARGLTGPEVSHNAKWNLTTPDLREISTADVAAAELSGVTPTKSHDTIGTSGDVDDATDPSSHPDHQFAEGGVSTAAQSPPTDPRLFPSVADSGLGALRLPLGGVVDTVCKSLLDSLPVDERVITALQFVAKPYYLYEERQRKGPEMTECTYLD